MVNKEKNKIILQNVSQGGLAVAYRVKASMDNIEDNLTIKDVAKLLRCSRTHVQNALRGKVPGMPILAHLPMGRRKIVRRRWLNQWVDSNKAC